MAQFFSYIAALVNSDKAELIDFYEAQLEALRYNCPPKLRFTAHLRAQMGKTAKALGLKALQGITTLVTPDTLLRWNRECARKKWDYSKERGPGRPRTRSEIVRLLIRWAHENPNWGYSRLQGALRGNGFKVSRQTVANILKKHGILPSPNRSRHTTWGEFIQRHKDSLVGCDFFTAEVWEGLSLVTYYVLFFVHLGTRKVHLAGITPHPTGEWMSQVARNLTMEGSGFLRKSWWVLHDRGGQFCPAFLKVLKEAGVHTLRLPYRSPNMNAFAERWVRSVKEECLSKLILVGEPMLRGALREYVEHYHRERPHQGVGNVILFPETNQSRGSPKGRIVRKSRLGGLLNYYHRRAG